MRGLLRRFQRSPSSTARVALHEGGVTEFSSQRSSKFRLSSATGSSKAVRKAFVPSIKLVRESPVTPTPSRKRDRLKNYLSRRRDGNTKGEMPYVWPAMLSAEKEEQRSSDDTVDGDDVYMLDYDDDSDSDIDSLPDDDFVTPPVNIPEMYRRQDRLGGVTVAGARVLFTYAGFKRQQMMVGKLQSLPESGELLVSIGIHREPIVIGAYPY